MLVVFAVLVTVKTEGQGLREILNCWIRIACGKRGEIETEFNLSDARIQLISGHESKKGLQIYQHLSLGAVEQAYQEAVQGVSI